jgi:hypothetical protein
MNSYTVNMGRYIAPKRRAVSELPAVTNHKIMILEHLINLLFIFV